jgi:hypothetical protein
MTIETMPLLEKLEGMIGSEQGIKTDTKYAEGLRDGILYGLMQAQDLIIKEERANKPPKTP